MLSFLEGGLFFVLIAGVALIYWWEKHDELKSRKKIKDEQERWKKRSSL